MGNASRSRVRSVGAANRVHECGGELWDIEMELGVGYTVAPGRKHRITAISDSMVLECSTPETGTTIRLEDDYGRPDETEAARQLR